MPRNDRPSDPGPEFVWLGRMPFDEGLEIQDRCVRERRGEEIGDRVLLLEHEPVYTIGRTRDKSSLIDTDSLPHPVVEINRGGKATYHGPGQLVGYPILDLAHYGRDLHAYLRTLEDALIDTCREYGIEAGRRRDFTGVWIDDRKIAAIGVGVRHWVSMHGFALNVCGDLSPFSRIIPCGIEGATVTSLEKETGVPVEVLEVAEKVQPALRKRLDKLKRGS